MLDRKLPRNPHMYQTVDEVIAGKDQLYVLPNKFLKNKLMPYKTCLVSAFSYASVVWGQTKRTNRAMLEVTQEKLCGKSPSLERKGNNLSNLWVRQIWAHIRVNVIEANHLRTLNQKEWTFLWHWVIVYKDQGWPHLNLPTHSLILDTEGVESFKSFSFI